MYVRTLAFLSCLGVLILSGPHALAQSTNNNPWVKLEGGRLWVLSSDNTTYDPYFIKGVGYQPIPVGRYPSDWGYAPTDPRSAINNIYDDPEILNRDFSILQKMNANTIRIWKGNKTTVSCFCANNARFPDYITDAGTTNNADTTQNTLDLAAHYGLKVIAGFWVNFLVFDADNNVSSFDDNGNSLSSQQIIANFVNYVNTYKTDRAILFWSIGNENNVEVLNGSAVPRAVFENAFGVTYGDSIYDWLQQTGNFLDFDGDIIVDVHKDAIVQILMNQYPSDYTSILNILGQYAGQKLNPAQLSAWYALVDKMALAAHLAEDPSGGANHHPVAVVNADIVEIGDPSYGAADSQLPNLDLWGTNIYFGRSFGSLFTDYAAKSQKPLWISEFGIDAWDVTDATGINDWGNTLSEDLRGQGHVDEATQSDWDGNLWNEILHHPEVAIGGTVMEYSDEWWKPYEFYCTSPANSQSNNTISAGICNSNPKYFGVIQLTSPDQFTNEEWYGVMSINPNPAVGGADLLTPRAVYSNLQTQWQADPWGRLLLNITGPGSGTMISPGSSLGPGLNCHYFAGKQTGRCQAYFPAGQAVPLWFIANNSASRISNWGAGQCAANAPVCQVSADGNVTLNVTVSQAPPFHQVRR